jgi:hypothetical protein
MSWLFLYKGKRPKPLKASRVAEIAGPQRHGKMIPGHVSFVLLVQFEYANIFSEQLS